MPEVTEGVASETELDLSRLMEVLPHRYPFLLIDRVDQREGTNRARGIKHLTANEEFFQGHFPGAPEMPHTLLLECMAQTGAAAVLAAPENQGKHVLFASIDKCRLGRPARPGDTLEIMVEMLSLKREMGKMRATCWVGGEEIGSGDLMFALADAPAAD